MQLPGSTARVVFGALPLWPPIVATRGPGGTSGRHRHHAIHFVAATTGRLQVRSVARGRWRQAAAVLTPPDVAHEIDAGGVEVALVFIDPESDAGLAMQARMGTKLWFFEPAQRDALLGDFKPADMMGKEGPGWTGRIVGLLGEARLPLRSIHPRVRRLLALLRELPPGADVSLPALARKVGLSPGRLMHAFTESIGIPLRPYLAWLRLQRAAAAVVSGASLGEVAVAAGFSDSAHMTRSFRRMFGVTPSALRPVSPA